MGLRGFSQHRFCVLKRDRGKTLPLQPPLQSIIRRRKAPNWNWGFSGTEVKTASDRAEAGRVPNAFCLARSLRAQLAHRKPLKKKVMISSTEQNCGFFSNLPTYSGDHKKSAMDTLQDALAGGAKGRKNSIITHLIPTRHKLNGKQADHGACKRLRICK